MEQTLGHSNHAHDDHEHGFDEYVATMSKRVEAITVPLFTTDATGLFDLYLSYLPTRDRQYYNCNTCRSFFERFGGLVTIRPDGSLDPVMWDHHETKGFYNAAVIELRVRVSRAQVTGVFLSKERTYGTPVTNGPVRWTHFAVKVDEKRRYKGRLLSADQAMAEKREDFSMLSRALSELSKENIDAAVGLLRSDTLYRSEKVLGVAEWLQAIKANQRKGDSRTAARHKIWLAVAQAPAGFCHVRSSMIGTLLEDLRIGKSLDDVKASFAAKMRPDRYQRPTAAPALGTIKQAEEMVAKLGIESALERRFARFEEVETIWIPTAPKAGDTGGVFGHLKTPKKAAAVHASTAVEKITWAAFARKVLPLALEMHVQAPATGPYIGLLSATHDDAELIFKWNHPVSWYMYMRGSTASNWGLATGQYVKVTGVTDLPCHWRGQKTPGFPDGKIFLLEGAKDAQTDSLGLFPEILKSELHSVRSVIEAHSRAGRKTGREQASACGIDVVNQLVRVTMAGGVQAQYRIDRLE